MSGGYGGGGGYGASGGYGDNPGGYGGAGGYGGGAGGYGGAGTGPDPGGFTGWTTPEQDHRFGGRAPQTDPGAAPGGPPRPALVAATVLQVITLGLLVAWIVEPWTWAVRPEHLDVLTIGRSLPVIATITGMVLTWRGSTAGRWIWTGLACGGVLLLALDHLALVGLGSLLTVIALWWPGRRSGPR